MEEHGEPVKEEIVKPIILNAIYGTSRFINEQVTGIISANPTKIYTIVIDDKKAMLIDQADLPDDHIDHPHKAKTHFYFMVLKDGVCYEGYIYLLNPNFHLSVIRAFKGEAFVERDNWLKTKGVRK